MTKLYRMKPLVWEPTGGMRLNCHHRFYINIWSNDCELYQYQDGSDTWAGMYSTVDEAKAAAEKLALEEALRWVEEVTPEAPRWIPVGERMQPDDPGDQSCSVRVMVVTKYGSTYCAWRSKGSEEWHDYDGTVSLVTHWMALPQPPKGGE